MHILLDTNVFLHALDARIDRQKTIDCLKIFDLAEQLKISPLFNAVILFEFFFQLKMFYGLLPKEMYAKIGGFFMHQNITESRTFHTTSAVPLMKSYSLEYPDAVIAQNALEEDIPLLSYDKDFDRVEGLIRLEPKMLIRKFS